MNTTAERIAKLSPEKLQLLSKRLKKSSANSNNNISRRNGSQTLPLSYAQQRLWFLDQLEPNNPFYNNPAAVRLSGELNVAALEQSLTEIVVRHETLRTTFPTVNSQPVQVISSPGPFTLPVFDLVELRGPAQEEKVRQLVREEAANGFDLKTGPLLRARLLRLGEREHVLSLTMHHIVSDGWSMGVLVRELCALYEAFSQGHESPLAALGVQYADYAQWQREHLAGAVLEQQLEYWREQLAGAPALLELPADHARPAVQSFRGARESMQLGAELTRELQELSRAEGVTLFMSLLAGFAVLLSRYTGRQDIVVGTDVANRNRKETEGLIGFFINQLVLRVDLSGNPTVSQLLSRVREITLGAYDLQDVPFDKVVETVRPARSLQYSPLFQIKLCLQNMPAEKIDLRGLSLSLLKNESTTSQLDFTLNLVDDKQELKGIAEYNTDIFNSGTIQRLLERFKFVLSCVARNKELRLDELTKIIDEGEKQQRIEAELALEASSAQSLSMARRKTVR
jgi:hypothetical protein